MCHVNALGIRPYNPSVQSDGIQMCMVEYLSHEHLAPKVAISTNLQYFKPIFNSKMQNLCLIHSRLYRRLPNSKRFVWKIRYGQSRMG